MTSYNNSFPFSAVPGKFNEVAAHVLLTFDSPPSSTRKRLGMGLHGENTFHTSLDITDNSIKIRHPGYYYIYCQVTFLRYGTGRTSSRGIPLSFHVYRYSRFLPNDGNEQLLRSSETPPAQGQHGSFSEQVRYTGALVYLRAQDELFVSVSDITSGSHYRGSSFFGVVKV